MKEVVSYLKPYIGRMLAGFLIKVTGTFLDLGLPWVLAYIIDDVIPIGKISLILIWGIVMLLFSIGARMSNIIANRMASRVAADTVQRLRHDLFWKIEHLSGAQLDRFSIPSLVSRMTSDTYNIHQMVGMMQRLGVRGPIILIGGIIITLTLEPVLTLVLLAILPMLSFVVYMVSKKGIPLYSAGQSAADRMIRTVRENISGIRVIKALSKSDFERKRYQEVNEDLVDKEMKAGITMAAINPVMNVLLNVGLTMVVVIGAFRVNSGASEVGKIVAFLSYFTMILNAVLMVTRIFVILSKASASAARISEVLTAEEELKLYEEKIYPASTKKGEFHIEFQQVSFTYNNSSECIKDINFQIKKGESLGIIGSTGSGKTTLLNLLMRYYDVKEGSIFINGKDIRTIAMQDLRLKFGVAFQNDSIFANTVKENVNFSREIPDKQIRLAVQDAQAKEFIEKLDGKYDYTVSAKGMNLSGGQKQRLLIARALAGNPEILILDDSSSALDYKTDSDLRRAIKENYKDTTIIMIAQRISSIMHMDHILVMEDGAMIGYGKHEQLMKSCSVYREIYQSQMGEVES